MDIYEFAMQMELDGEKLYRGMRHQTADPGIQRILDMLADDEARHYQIVRQLRDGAPVGVSQTAVLAGARNVFAEMQGRSLDLRGTQVQVYIQARQIERQSQEFYQDKAQVVSEPGHKATLLALADEERRHYILLDHVIEFLSRPHTWIENAEFTHLDDY